jgi:MFS family permease
MFKEYNPTLRFGYRNAFFTPTILGISLYLISDERNLYKRFLYLLSILLSVAVIILGGNRTNYIVVFAILLLLIFYRWYKRESVLKQSSVILISFTITIALGLSFGYIMFGKAFLLYVFSRFSTLLSPHETLTDPSAQIRAYDFSLALSRFSLSPAFGRAEMDILTRWIEGSTLFFVDNSFINVLWKMGLFGFGVYILMLSYSLYIVIRGVLMKYDLAFFTLLLFISLLILSLTTSSLIYYIHIAVLMVCVGVISKKLSEVPN